MARTSAKAKKQKQEVSKSKIESGHQNPNEKAQDVKPVCDIEDTTDSTDKENDNSNFEVDKIVHTRVYHGKRQYLVRWKGYKEDSDTWENESVVQSCVEALEAFKKENSLLIERSKDDSDGEAEDEESQESMEEEAKEKKRTKRGTKKVIAKKLKLSSKSTKAKKDNQDEQMNSEIEEGIQEKDNEGGTKDKKGANKAAKKVPGKPSKQEDSQSKKMKHSEDSDGDESVTDGKNYEVEKILEVHKRKDGRREFLVRWKGYKPSDDTWEPEAHLNCSDLIDKFMEKVEKAKSIPARELRESRTPTKRYIPNIKAKGQRSNLRNIGYRPSYQE